MGLNNISYFYNSLLQVFRIWATRLGHVGAAAAASADEGGDFLDDLPSVVAIREVGGYQAEQHGLAVAFTAQKDNARTEPVLELVAQVAEGLRICRVHNG